MQSFRASLSLVYRQSLIATGTGTRLKPIQRLHVHHPVTTTTGTGLRRFGVSRPVWEETGSLERLEVREKGQAQDGPDGKPKGNVERATTTGKLLTTPSRLFKLLLPLATIEHNPQYRGKKASTKSKREKQAKKLDIEPIAVLIHPQQPLSYLERLIQSEIPQIKDPDGRQRSPAVSFIALQLEEDAIRPRKTVYENTDTEARRLGSDEADAIVRRRQRESDDDDDGGQTYSYLQGKTAQSDKVQHFVRWSQSTEIGDFIRDAARAQEFIVSIEGAPSGQGHIRVTVPSFNERTYFLRMRLRKVALRIQSIADIKHECDVMAHRGAQRVAIGGFGVLSFWWLLVYKLTFDTDLGWDTMEPVTYLASLSTLMGGYLWFLYHNREISYKSALDFTISARQKKLYQTHGVDLRMWDMLIDEGNTLRREIKNIAAEYDAEWDEIQDEQDQRVANALKKERHQKNGKREESRDDDEDEDGDDRGKD